MASPAAAAAAKNSWSCGPHSAATSAIVPHSSYS
jgi:hypothetical protein